MVQWQGLCFAFPSCQGFAWFASWSFCNKAQAFLQLCFLFCLVLLWLLSGCQLPLPSSQERWLGQCLCQGASFWQGILTESSKALLLARNLHLPGALWQGVFILSCWWCSKASRVALAVQGHFTDFLNVCISLSFFSMRSMTSCKCRNSRDVSLPAHILRSSPCFSLRLSTLILTQRPPFHLLWLRAGCSIKTCIAACLRFPGCISAVDSKVTSPFIKGSTFSSAFGLQQLFLEICS